MQLRKAALRLLIGSILVSGVLAIAALLTGEFGPSYPSRRGSEAYPSARKPTPPLEAPRSCVLAAGTCRPSRWARSAARSVT